eukprot:3899231-Rhodomonas_salina.2
MPVLTLVAVCEHTGVREGLVRTMSSGLQTLPQELRRKYTCTRICLAHRPSSLPSGLKTHTNSAVQPMSPHRTQVPGYPGRATVALSAALVVASDCLGCLGL